MKILEAIFGEGVKIDSLDPKQLNELQGEAKEYLKDWPTEALSIKFTFSTDGNENCKLLSLDVFEIPRVRDLVSLLADGLGWDLAAARIKDSDVQTIFSFLSGAKGDIDSDRQSMKSPNHAAQLQKVDYSYKINSWKYNHGQDVIELDGTIVGIDLNI